MGEYGFDAPRATLLENEGRLVDAAESRLSEGNVLEAIQLFIRDQENPAESIARAVKHFLNYLWRRMSYGVAPLGATELKKDHSTFQLILDIAEQLGQSCADRDDRDEVRTWDDVIHSHADHAVCRC